MKQVPQNAFDVADVINLGVAPMPERHSAALTQQPSIFKREAANEAKDSARRISATIAPRARVTAYPRPAPRASRPAKAAAASRARQPVKQRQQKTMHPTRAAKKASAAHALESLTKGCHPGASFVHWSCGRLQSNISATLSKEDASLDVAMRPLCEIAKFQPIFETRVDCGFAQNYREMYDASGWIDEAFVTYVKGAPTSKYVLMVDALIKSAHEFSTRPVIVFCVDSACPWVAKNYPRLMVLNLNTTKETLKMPLDMYKWLGLILSRVRTGVELDADMMVLPSVDMMFER
jgi:hypothetical protein